MILPCRKLFILATATCINISAKTSEAFVGPSVSKFVSSRREGEATGRASISVLQMSEEASTTSPSTQSSANDNASANGGLLLSNLTAFSTDGEVRLILASQSPRRREILDMMGLANRYIVQPSPLDEEKLQEELAASPIPIPPQDYARKLAESKASALGEEMMMRKQNQEQKHFSNVHVRGSTFILGSDTIVDMDGKILEKPKGVENAKAMLTQLSGSWHEVHTGVALYRMDHRKCDGDDESQELEMELELVSSFTDTAKVKFTTLTADDINAYVATGEPMDKAGSYGIQGIGGQMVERMEGDFFTVMGLPMHRVSGVMANALAQSGFVN